MLFRSGDATRLTRLDAQQAGHRFPKWLPDGKHFLYYSPGSPQQRGIYVGEAGGPGAARVVDSESAAVYLPAGYLLFVRGGTLFAQRFDVTTLQVSGASLPVADHVAVDAYGAALSGSLTGTIIFRTGTGGGAPRQFVWIDRTGKEMERVGEPDANKPVHPALSAGGRRIAYQQIGRAHV